jgi:hypothetical protein
VFAGRGGAAVAARAEAAPAPAPRPIPRPKVAPRPASVPRPSRRSTAQPFAARLIASLRSLPEHAFLDRLVRGRAWIPLLGVLLAGIVAMQVEVLRMSASMGRSIASSSQLQIRNDQLRSTIASLADDQRIMRLAESMGMVMPHPNMVGFLSPLPSGALDRAIRGIHPPDATNFLYSAANYGSSATNGDVVTLAGLQTPLSGIGGSPSLGGPGATAAGGTGSTAAGSGSQSGQAGAFGTGAGGAANGAGGGASGGGQISGAGAGGQSGGTTGGQGGGTTGGQGGGATGGQGGGVPGSQGGGTTGGQGGGAPAAPPSGGVSTPPTGAVSIPQAGAQTPGG